MLLQCLHFFFKRDAILFCEAEAAVLVFVNFVAILLLLLSNNMVTSFN